MPISTTSTVYLQVIDDVVSKIRQEFINAAGPGEGVLNELQQLWELKMMQSRAILVTIDRSSTNPVHDLDVPYEGPQVYEIPTADLLFPPIPFETPMQTPWLGQTPLAGTVDVSYNIPTGGTPVTQYDNPPVNENKALENRAGRPSLYMQPPSPWLTQRLPLDVNAAYDEGREDIERGAASQPMTLDFFHASSGKRKREDFPSQYPPSPSGFIPQQDGAGDVQADNAEIHNYEEVVSDDCNVANTPTPPELQARTPAMVNQNDVLGDDEDEPLNENDDDDDDIIDVDQNKELDTHQIILSQFDKVTRAKSRWKCTLNYGVMHINNKDILFNKATGEFDF